MGDGDDDRKPPTGLIELEKRRAEWSRVLAEASNSALKSKASAAKAEEYDSRPLYVRVDEQRRKQEEAYLEEQRLKNKIRGVDEKDIEFFEAVEDARSQREARIKAAEQLELAEFQRQRMANAEISKKTLETELLSSVRQPEKATAAQKKPRPSLLNGIVKVKPKPGHR